MKTFKTCFVVVIIMNPIFEKELDGLNPIVIKTWKFERKWSPDENVKIEKVGENHLSIGEVNLPIDKDWIFYDAQYVLEKPLVISMAYIVPDKLCEPEKRYVGVVLTYSKKESGSPKQYKSYKTSIRMSWIRPVMAFDYANQIRSVMDLLKDQYPVFNKIAERIVNRFGQKSFLMSYFTTVTQEDIERAYRPYLLGTFSKYIEI